MITKSSFSERRIRLNRAIHSRKPRITLIFRLILRTPSEPQKFSISWSVVGKTFLIAGLFVVPISANAGVFSFVADLFGANAEAEVITESTSNSQKMPLLQAVINSDPTPKKDIQPTIESGNSLVTSTGPSGSAVNVKEIAGSDQITTYIVREGDTLPSVAKMFGVTSNTIIWANDLKSGTTRLAVGQRLVILPISGLQHVVKKGETLKSIAVTYKGDLEEILQYNNLAVNAKVAVGDTITIPNGEVSSEAGPVKKKPTVKTKVSAKIAVAPDDSNSSYADTTGYFQRPISAGRRTQGLHGHNGVDLADSVGTPIRAAAGGQVIIARSTGWNGGYGEYVVISHPNGTQTLYAHLSEVDVVIGDTVVKGQTIAKMGNSGNSTGTHLHFEVRGGSNPF